MAKQQFLHETKRQMDTSKIVERILDLKNDTSRIWEKDLDEMGIWPYVSVLYGKGRWDSTANVMVAFIILAYSNKSNWVETHKDRVKNKREILHKLGVEDTSREHWQDLIYGRPPFDDIIKWFINWQQDWRWQTISAALDYYSNMMQFAQSKTPTTKESLSQGIPVTITATHADIAQANQRKGDLIEKATAVREKADQMLTQIRREYMQLDTICEQEGRIKATDDFDQTSLEYFHYLKDQKQKNAANKK